KNKVGSEDMAFMLEAVKQKRSDFVSRKKVALPPAPANPKAAGPKNTGAPNEPAANKPRSSTDPAARAVIDRAIKAMGGEEKLTQALKGCTWKTRGILNIGGGDNPISTDSTLAGLDKYRYKFKAEFGGMEIEGVAVLNGDKGVGSFNGNEMGFDQDAV